MDRSEFRQRLANRPNSVRFEELESLLHLYGWELVRSRGSHRAFRRGGETLIAPYRRPVVLAVYVKLALQKTAGEDDEQE
jgi:hypothetical protein